MSDKPETPDNLEAMDAECKRILALSDDEIRAEIIAEGGDPEEYIRSAREAINSVIAAHKLWGELMIANVEGGDHKAKLVLSKALRTAYEQGAGQLEHVQQQLSDEQRRYSELSLAFDNLLKENKELRAASTPIAEDVKGLAETVIKLVSCAILDSDIDKAASIIQAFMDSRMHFPDMDLATPPAGKDE